MMRFIVIALSASVATGCMMGPNYQRPELPTSERFRFATTTEAQSLADVPWFQVFDDPQLQALIKEALANNLDLAAAIARVEEARARAGISKSYLYPEVTGAVGYAARGATGGEDDEDNTIQSGTYGFSLSWELDLFGKLRRQREAADAIAFATEQARRGVVVTLVGDIAANYFLLREIDLQLEIARKTLALNDETVTYFRNRLDGGVSNRLELDRIVSLRADTASAIPELERQAAVIENLLSLLAGRAPGPVPRAALVIGEQLPPPIPPGLPAALIERRPDVLQAEQQLVAANANIGAAKALFFPTISLTGFLGGVSGDLTEFIGGGGGVWSLAPGLVQPIFNAGRLKRNVEAEEARFRAALAIYKQAALNGYREVANSLVTIEKLAQIRREQETGVVALTDASELARERYDSGLASYLEILTADQELFGRQLRLAQTRGAELRARSELYRALGGGWQVQQP